MHISRSILPLLLGTSIALTLSACESSGSGRVASVGGQSAGQSSADGSGTGASGSGSGSASGGAQGSSALSQVPVDTGSATGGATSLASAGNAVLPTSGSPAAVGAGGSQVVGGSGSNPALGVSVVSPDQNSGSVATAGAGSNGNLASASVPDNGTLTGTSALPDATGSNLVNADANNSQVLGTGQSSPIGASALSSGQANGSLVTAGAASGGNTATVNSTVPSNTLGTGALGPLTVR